MNKICFLIGFMGSGKTYWGSRLAGALGVTFIDLDEWISRGEAASIAELFERHGAAGFREIERRYLHFAATSAPAIVATGGGTPCFFDNMDWMNRHGTTLYLEVPVEVLASRLQAEAQSRPLLHGIPEAQLERRIFQLLSSRRRFYESAQITVPYSEDEPAFLKQLSNALGRF